MADHWFIEFLALSLTFVGLSYILFDHIFLLNSLLKFFYVSYIKMFWIDSIIRYKWLNNHQFLFVSFYQLYEIVLIFSVFLFLLVTQNYDYDSDYD